MSISYVKNNNNSMYFLQIDNIRIASKIYEYLNMSFEEYIEIIQLCGGKYSPKYGWFLPNEDSAIKCATTLMLMKS